MNGGKGLKTSLIANAANFLDQLVHFLFWFFATAPDV